MKLESEFDLKAIEKKVKEYYQGFNLKGELEKELRDRKKVGFIEGPPTMNGEPHVGHIRGRIMKDLWYRFSTLRKLRVIFNAGWDTQGLPVELQVEKELGLTGSKAENLKKVGMEKIVEHCKQLVHRYNEKWREADRLLGISLDHEAAYWTYHDKYIEREWRYLKRAWEQGILVEGYRVVAYCPSCQTSLSHAEVSQGYEVVEDPSLYYKVKLDDDLYMIVWTTMPFTLVTDEMVGVNSDAEYSYVKVGDEIWIIAKERIAQLMQELKINEYSILKNVRGKDLEGKHYIHPLLDEIPALKELADNKEIHFVVAEEFVDVNTGSGVVHLSPSNGEEDFEIASKRNIPIFNPIDDQVRFTEEAGIFKGLFVRDSDHIIIEKLKEHGALVKIGKIKHEYPTCWRSHHKLVWLARREYFIMVDKIGDMALKAAEKVEYYYSEPKNRFLGIISEFNPWCISRERVWGAPLPIWVCSKCKHKTAFFSREDIVKNALKLPDGPNFELHRPWIDRVTVRCEECGEEAFREPFVLDTWHNSGAAPYASLTNEEFEEMVPVPFLTEGIDQTRGWAYTLLIENVIMKGRDIAPFQSFLFQGHVLDEKGNKMSKSLGNVIDGIELLKNNAVDLVRFYFMWKASPIDALNFSVEEMRKRPYQVLSTLYHLHIYFMQNSSYDNFANNTLQWAIERNLLRESEKWMLSKLQKLIDAVTEGYAKCRFHEAARALEDFIINVVSQTYLPLTRNEIWDDSEENRERRFAIYAVLAYTLQTLDTLLHPISPFITEYLYISCFKGKSILLTSWPIRDERLVDDEIERSFDLLKSIVSIANSARMKASLKRRWPLKKVYICIKSDYAKILYAYNELLRSQINVEEIKIVDLDTDELFSMLISMIDKNIPITLKLSLKRASIAPRLKAETGKVIEAFNNIDHLKVLRDVVKGKFILSYDGKEVEITKDDLEVEYDTSEGYAMVEKEKIFVLISTVRDQDLIAKGLVRDLARRLQALRKERGYNPTEILDAAYIANIDDDSIALIEDLREEMSYLVRVKHVELMKEARDHIKWAKSEIDGKEILISVE